MTETMRYRRPSALLYVLLVGGLAGYLLPWIVAQTAPMTLNAYDLAEWMSLHPPQWHSNPPYAVPLMLRMQLVIVACLAGLLATSKKPRTLAVVLIIILAIAQLPPLEFLSNINNLNYRQQFLLAGAGLIVSLALIPLKSNGIATFLFVALPLTGGVTAVHGTSEALKVYIHFGHSGEAGAGLWLLVAAYCGIVAVTVSSIVRTRDRS